MSLHPPGLTFVVGTGRCGSTLLSRMLEDADSIASLSEFFTLVGPETAFPQAPLSGEDFWRLLNGQSAEVVALLDAARVPEVGNEDAIAIRTDSAPPLSKIAFRGVTTDPTRLYEELRTALSSRGMLPVADHYRHLFAHVGERGARSVVVERSGGSLAYAGAISAHFGEASFVHLFREGADTALSMSQHPYFRVLLARLLHRDPSLPIRACLALEIPLDRFGAFWSATILRGLSVLARLPPGRVLHVSFSQLLKHPKTVLERLADFLGIRADGSWMESAEARIRKVESRVTALPPAPLAALERACVPGMRALARLPQA